MLTLRPLTPTIYTLPLTILETTKFIGITVTPVNGNPRQVKVAPPTNGWQAGETYFLFISKRVQSSTAYGCQALKNGVRMRFNISSYNNDVVL